MILLTGGTGFVGRHLLQQFVTDGHPVRVLSRAPSPVVRNPVVFWIEGDLEHPASLRTAVQGIDVVLHAAAVLPGPRTQDGAIERINVGGTESLA
ncbi:MAG: NAD-dependent epimerase/dehydratase family protein, partial [Gemmatimonadales bacterium]